MLIGAINTNIQLYPLIYKCQHDSNISKYYFHEKGGDVVSFFTVRLFYGVMYLKSLVIHENKTKHKHEDNVIYHFTYNTY